MYMDENLYKYSLNSIKNELFFFDDECKDVKSTEFGCEQNWCLYLNGVFEHLDGEQILEEFVRPNMLFHLNVNISETREIELPNINTNKFIFYMYISASINKKKLKSGNVVHSMEELRLDRTAAIRRSLNEKSEIVYESELYEPIDHNDENTNGKVYKSIEIKLDQSSLRQDLIIECYGVDSNLSEEIVVPVDLKSNNQIKKAWKSFKHIWDTKKRSNDFIGQVRIPIKKLKDAQNEWFDLVANRKSNTNASYRGKIRLHACFQFINDRKMFDNYNYSIRRNESNISLKNLSENRFCLAKDYNRLCRLVFEYEAKQTLIQQQEQEQQLQDQQQPSSPTQLGCIPRKLSERSSIFLKQFCNTYFIPDFIKELIELFTLVEMISENKESCQLLDYNCLNENLKTFLKKFQRNLTQISKKIVDDMDENLYEKYANNLIENFCDKFFAQSTMFYVNNDTPTIGGGTSGGVKYEFHLDNSMYLIIKIYEHIHYLFTFFNESRAINLQTMFAGKIRVKLLEDLSKILTKQIKIDEISDLNDSDCLEWIQNLIANIRALYKFVNEPSFGRNPLSDFNYTKLCSIRISDMLCDPIRYGLKILNDYQENYRNFASNMHKSSRVSLDLYLDCANLVKCLRSHIQRKELFKLKLNSYSAWFEEKTIFTFWLETYEILLKEYFDTGIKLEDFKEAADSDEVLYSTTAVVLTGHLLKMLDEWSLIKFQNLEIFKCCGMTSLNEIITNYCRQYALSCRKKLETANYYIGRFAEKITYKDYLNSLSKVSILVNNIQFMKNNVLLNLPKRLKLEETIKKYKKKSDDDFSLMSHIDDLLKTLLKSIEESIKDMDSISNSIIHEAQRRCLPFIENSLNEIINGNDKDPFDDLFKFLEDCVKFFQTKLKPYCIMYMNSLRTSLVELICNNFPDYKTWEFYHIMYSFLIRIDYIYIISGFTPLVVNDKILEECPEFAKVIEENKLYEGETPVETSFAPGLEASLDQLKQKLTVYSTSTSSLIMEHLKSLDKNQSNARSSDDTSSPIYFKAGYENVDRNTVSLSVEILYCDRVKIERLKNSTTDAFVKVELLPESFFKDEHAKSTRTLKKAERLVFNELIQFNNIPKELFKLKDVRMRVSLWEKDKNGYSICLGEHFRLLESFQEISSNISRVTVIKKSLVPLAFDLTDENLNELIRRCDFDQEANDFIESRRLRFKVEPQECYCLQTLKKLNSILMSTKCFPLQDIAETINSRISHVNSNNNTTTTNNNNNKKL